MAREVPDRIRDRVQTHALRHVLSRNQTQTNLSIDRHIFEPGERIGPAFQGIRAKTASVVVFADDKPLANFAHACRYLIYDAETGEFQREVAAQFPPTLRNGPQRLVPFFRPVTFPQRPPIVPWNPPWPCVRFWFKGNRYAILFSGCTQGRHLNDMEFCYRTLVNVYGFNPANVYALNYDGTLGVWDGNLGTWPGDNTNYQIQITGEGTRAGFQGAIADIQGKIGPDDLLFIHTNNHGGNDSNGSFLCAFEKKAALPDEFPDWTSYYASDFASDLAVLPAHKALVVMMEQCNSGGFNTPIINKSTATSKSVSAAATASTESIGGADWDPFAYQWIAAVNGTYPGGGALAYNPDTGHLGVVDASEAYNYAKAEDTSDTTQYNDSPSTETLSLDAPIEWGWFWCWILRPILEPIYREYFPPPSIPPNPNPPDPAPYYALLRQFVPEFQKTMEGAPQTQLLELRRQLVAQLTPIARGLEKRGSQPFR